MMIFLHLVAAGSIVPGVAAFQQRRQPPPIGFASSPSGQHHCQPSRSGALYQQPNTNNNYDPDHNNYESDGWSVADNWDALSGENPRNSAPDTSAIFNQDIAQNAAKSILPDDGMLDTTNLSEEEVWLDGIIEEIVQTPLSSTPLYDTGLEEDTVTATTTKKRLGNQQHHMDLQQKDFEDKMGEEIALLVRCNESPEDMLVRAGRAVPPLTVEEQNDVAQLVIWKQDEDEGEDHKSEQRTGHWEPTPFYRQAIAKMFHTYANPQPGKEEKEVGTDNESFLDARAISRWMTQSLGSELDSDTEKQRKQKMSSIGPHDSRVLKLLSKYSEYGTGKLSLPNFEQIYMDALIFTDNGMALKGSVETLQLRNTDHVRQVWRDLKNHNIIGPNQQNWNQEQAKVQARYGTMKEQTKKVLEHLDDADFMDECEILDYSYDAPPTKEQEQAGHDTKNDKYIRKSSHEHVKLAADGKTPLHMEEGSFVFIDEETCIGCMQCVTAAPASFLLLENGRARTFNQRNGPDVRQGVAACPVNCMHWLSHDELKELETVRDKGDGRDDHRHMGHRRGHTPLHVAGIDSDNNHRSSWYHHIKNKCCTSGQCPERGCYNCPSYRNLGENPFFQKKAKEAQHVRAKYFLDHGDADLWRKTADL